MKRLPNNRCEGFTYLKDLRESLTSCQNQLNDLNACMCCIKAIQQWKDLIAKILHHVEVQETNLKRTPARGFYLIKSTFEPFHQLWEESQSKVQDFIDEVNRLHPLSAPQATIIEMLLEMQAHHHQLQRQLALTPKSIHNNPMYPSLMAYSVCLQHLTEGNPSSEERKKRAQNLVDDLLKTNRARGINDAETMLIHQHLQTLTRQLLHLPPTALTHFWVLQAALGAPTAPQLKAS